MKRGFKQFFVQERLNTENTEERSVEQQVDSKRQTGFFQKFFRPSGLQSVSPRGSPQIARNADDKYQWSLSRTKESHTIWESRVPESRQMSVPVSPKSVKFEDEVISKRGRSAAPQTYAAQRNRTKYDLQNIRDTRTTTKILRKEALDGTEKNITSRTTNQPERKLDEATSDLLHLCSIPSPSFSYSSSKHIQPIADRIQKSASTSSMNKVIIAEDGSVKKLSNEFPRDEIKIKEKSKAKEVITERSRIQKSETIKTDKYRKGPPVIKTTVEGKMYNSNMVGAPLKAIEHCLSIGWTIKEIVTNYKVKTTLDDSSIIIEEHNENDVENKANNEYKISFYHKGLLKSEQITKIEIPSTMKKQDYLSKLGRSLLIDLKSSNQGEENSMIPRTRVEIELVEDVTKILKSYIVGERSEPLEMRAGETLSDDTSEYTSAAGYSYERADDTLQPEQASVRMKKRYIDSMERELEESSSLALMNIHRDSHSKTQTTVYCELNRSEDRSSNVVQITEANKYTIHMKIADERLLERKSKILCGTEQEGQHFIVETVLLHRKSPLLIDEDEQVYAKAINLTVATQAIVQVTVICDLKRRPDFSSYFLIIEVPLKCETVMKVLRQSRQLSPSIYEHGQKGQYFEGKIVFKKMAVKMVASESTEESDTDVTQITVIEDESKRRKIEPEAVLEMDVLGQKFEGDALLKRTKHFISAESLEDEVVASSIYIDLVKKSSHSDFVAIIIISNDIKGEHLVIREMKMSAIINTVFIFEKAQTKMCAQGLIVTRNSWVEGYTGKEIEEEDAHIILSVERDERFVSKETTTRNVSTSIKDQVRSKLKEFNEEQVMIKFGLNNEVQQLARDELTYVEKSAHKIYRFLNASEDEQIYTKIFIASPPMSDASVQVDRAMTNESSMSHFCTEISSKEVSCVVFLHNRLENISEESPTFTLKDARVSTGHSLHANASTFEDLHLRLMLSKEQINGAKLASEFNVMKTTMETTRFHTKEFSDMQTMSNFALNRGAKTGATNVRWLSGEQCFGDAIFNESRNESRNMAIVLQHSGVVQEHTGSHWSQSITEQQQRDRVMCYENVSSFMRERSFSELSNDRQTRSMDDNLLCEDYDNEFTNIYDVIFTFKVTRSGQSSNVAINIPYSILFTDLIGWFNAKREHQSDIEMKTSSSMIQKSSENIIRHVPIHFQEEKIKTDLSMFSCDQRYERENRVNQQTNRFFDTYSDICGYSEQEIITTVSKKEEFFSIEETFSTNDNVGSFQGHSGNMEKTFSTSDIVIREVPIWNDGGVGIGETSDGYTSKSHKVLNNDAKDYSYSTERETEENFVHLESELSRTRVAMLQAGFDLETILLATPAISSTWDTEETEVEQRSEIDGGEISKFCHFSFNNRGSNFHIQQSQKVIYEIPNEESVDKMEVFDIFISETSRERKAVTITINTVDEIVKEEYQMDGYNLEEESSSQDIVFAKTTLDADITRLDETYYCIKILQLITKISLGLKMQALSDEETHVSTLYRTIRGQQRAEIGLAIANVAENTSFIEAPSETSMDLTEDVSKIEETGLAIIEKHLELRLSHENKFSDQIAIANIILEQDSIDEEYQALKEDVHTCKVMNKFREFEQRERLLGLSIGQFTSYETVEQTQKMVPMIRKVELEKEFLSTTNVESEILAELQSIRPVYEAELKFEEIEKLMVGDIFAEQIETIIDSEFYIKNNKSLEDGILILLKEKSRVGLSLDAKEKGIEIEYLNIGWKIFECISQKEVQIPVANLQMYNLTLPATQNLIIEEDVKITQEQQSLLSVLIIPIKQCLKLSGTWIINSTINAVELQKDQESHTYEFKFGTKEKKSISYHIHEYGEDTVAGEFVFRIFEREDIHAPIDIKLNVPRKLEEQFEATEASYVAVYGEWKLKSEIERNDLHTKNYKEMTHVKNSYDLHASVESESMGSFTFDKVNHAEMLTQIFTDKNLQIIESISYPESSNERLSYGGKWIVVDRESQAECLYADAEFLGKELSVTAPTDFLIDMVKALSNTEESNFITEIKPISQIERSEIDLKISEVRLEDSLEDHQNSVEYYRCLPERIKETREIHLREFSKKDISITENFARIISRKVESEETHTIKMIVRMWSESFYIKASCEEYSVIDCSLSTSEQLANYDKVLKDCYHHSEAIALKASSEESFVQNIAFSSPTIGYQEVQQVVPTKNRHFVFSENYHEFIKGTESLDATWSLFTNDLQTETNLPLISIQKLFLNTEAMKEVTLLCESKINSAEPILDATANFPIVPSDDSKRNFYIKNQYYDTFLQNEAEILPVVRIFKDLTRGESINYSFAESEEINANSGIFLIRRPAYKVHLDTSHSINKSITVQQFFSARCATETNTFTNLNLSLELPVCKVVETKHAVTTDNASFDTIYAREESVEHISSLRLHSEHIDTAESTVKSKNSERVIEKLRETDSKAFEILTEWIIIDNDLEAEINMQDMFTDRKSLTTVACSDQHITLDEFWNAEEVEFKVGHTISLTDKENCKQTFHIENDYLKITLEKYPKYADVKQILADKNLLTSFMRLRESEEAKLNAIINLHKIAHSRMVNTDSYVCFISRVISTEVLNLRCEDFLSDSTNLSSTFNAKHVDNSIEYLIVSTNSIAPVYLECESSSEENILTYIHMKGELLTAERYELCWPIPNSAETVHLETVQTDNELISLHVQLSSLSLFYKETEHCFNISRKQGPFYLETNASTIEDICIFTNLEIPPMMEVVNVCKKDFNRGENILIRFKEAKLHLITFGYQYKNKIQEQFAEKHIIEARFGGKYELSSNEARDEYRNTNVDLVKSTYLESVKQRIPQKLSLSKVHNISASSVEVCVTEIKLDKIAMNGFTENTCMCKRSMEPMIVKLFETVHNIYTVHADFHKRNSFCFVDTIKALSNNYSRLVLNTEFADEIKSDSISSFRFNEEFHHTVAVYPCHNATALCVSLKASCEEIETIFSELRIIDESEYIYKNFILSNRGEDIRETLKESSDIRQTSYYEHFKNEQHLSTLKVANVKRFGGRFYLLTDASEIHEMEIVRELIRDRILVEHFTKFITEFKKYSISLNTFAIKLTSCEVMLSLVAKKSMECATVCIKKKNIYKSTYSIHECTEAELTMNINYAKQFSEYLSETILPVKRDGGVASLHTNSAFESTVSSALSLDKQIDAEFSVQQVVLIRNEATPVRIATSHSKDEQNFLISNFSKLEQMEAIIVTRLKANKGEDVCKRLKEVSYTDVITYSIYGMKDAVESTEKTLYESNFGGSLVLIAYSCSEEKVDCIFSFASLVNNDLTSSKKIVIANSSTEIPVLHKKFADEIDLNANIVLKNASSYDHCKYIRKTAIVSRADMKMLETSIIEVNYGIALNKSEAIEDSQKLYELKRFGGSIIMKTKFASEVNFLQSLSISSAKTHLECTRILIKTSNKAVALLETGSSKEIMTEILAKLQRPTKTIETESKRCAANNELPLFITLKESINEIINTSSYFVKTENHLETSSTLTETRLGGYFKLNTHASEEKAVVCEFRLTAKRSEVFFSLMVISISNKLPQLSLATYAASDEIVQLSTILQRISDLQMCSKKLLISREGGLFTHELKESSDIMEFNSLQLKRMDETERCGYIFNEKRFGGSISLSSMRATDIFESVSLHLINKTANKFVSKVNKTSNDVRPEMLKCRCTEYISSNTVHKLFSQRIESHGANIQLICSNKGVSMNFYSFESSEQFSTLNLALHKEVHDKSSSVFLNESRYGGGNHLRCVAASDSSTGIIPLHIKKEAVEFNTISTQLISNSISNRITVDASKYMAYEMDRELVLPEKTDEVRWVISIARYGGKLIFTTYEAHETIFNIDASFRKETSEGKYFWLARIARSEQPKHLITRASTCTETGTIEMRIQRRLVHSHLEISTLRKEIRKISPIVLKTDYASETFVRFDLAMRSATHRHYHQLEHKACEVKLEHERLSCAIPVQVILRHEDEYREESKEERSEKRVSFAAEVTERTLTMDMSMTVERREAPSILRKPMKKEQKTRRTAIRQNEAPNFIPVRRNSLLMAMNIGSPHNIPHFKTLQDVIRGIEKAGLEYSNLIFGIDYTRSNYYQGDKTFDGKNLHALDSDEMNPYQQVIDIVGKTLSSFDADGVIPAYGFGDEKTTDQGIFNIYDCNDMEAECNGFEEVLKKYNEKTPNIKMSGPTNFVPLIEKAIDIVRNKQSYHILVIVADGQVTNEKINQKAIAAASHYPLSIIMVGVGDGPWSMMTRFDETLPKRIFDNFHFVDFHKVIYDSPNQEAAFALNALMEIPDQYKAIKDIGLLKRTKRR